MPRLKIEDVQRLSSQEAFYRRKKFKKRSPVVEALEEKCCEGPYWAYQLRRYVRDLPEEVKRKAELRACEDPEAAYQLRRDVSDLSEEIERKAELKACEDPKWALWLRCDVPDLSEEIQRKAELKACEDPECAYRLRRVICNLSDEIQMKAELKACEDPGYFDLLLERVENLHPVTKKVIELIRLGMDYRSAVNIVQREEQDAETQA